MFPLAYYLPSTQVQFDATVAVSVEHTKVITSLDQLLLSLDFLHYD
jgi:hypothetical protein